MDGLRELDRIGTLVAGKYRLESILGRGGMGTVYRATHSWTGRPVAVKLMHQEYAHDAAAVGRFLREARAAAAVRHPNAVDVLDMGQDEDRSAYLVLELLDGDTLATHLEKVGRLTPEQTVHFLAPVFEALEELHHAGVVHRDLKPANIFLARSNRGAIVPKLLDFGVAKVLEANSSMVTTTGIVVGTPAYMAPEQAAGNGNIGPWTDIWAAGTVLFECLTGELPFSAPTPSLMLVDVMTKAAPSLASKRPDLSPALCAVVDRALQKDPRARHPSLSELVAGLCTATGVAVPEPLQASGRSQAAYALTDHALSTPMPASAPTLPATPSVRPEPAEPPATGPTTTARTRTPRRRAYAVAGVAIVALALGGLGLRFGRTGDPRPTPAGGAPAQTPVKAATAPLAPTPTAPAAPAPVTPEPSAPPTTQAAAPAPTLTPISTPPEPLDGAAPSARRDRPKRERRKQVAPSAAPEPAPAKPAANDARAPSVEREW